MRKALKILLVCLTTIIVAAATICVAAASAPPPIKVWVSDGVYEYSVEPTLKKGQYIVYLPGTLDLSAVTVEYTGSKMLCDASDDPSLYRGDTLVCKASSGKIEVKEYDSTKKNYTTYTVKVLQGGNIGSVYITLDGGEDAFKNVNASKENKEAGDIIVTDKLGNLVYDGELTKFSGHGLTSFTASYSTDVKNSYNFKIGKKTELLSDAGKSKKWVLLTPRMYSGERDSSGMSQIAAFGTFSALIGDQRASIKGEYVDLYVNGEYRGLYILTERMNNKGSINVTDIEDYVTSESSNLKTVRDRENKGKDNALNTGLHKYTYDKNAKLTDKDIDITGGYVLEVMCETYEGCGFETKHGLDISIKSPEICTKEMVQYIAAYVQNFENALYSETGYNSEGKHYSEYADLKSLADTVLVYSYYINFEYFRTSTYIYKNADGEENDILTFGPAWDFETGAECLATDKTLFGTTNGFVYNVDQQYIWSEQLWSHGDFMSLIASENERMKEILDQQLGHTDSATVKSLSSIANDASLSADMNYSRWGVTNFNDVFSDFISAANKRYKHWYNNLWNPEKYLISLDIDVTKNDDGTLTLKAVINGQNDGKIRWYKLDEENPENSKSYAVFFDEITVQEDGSKYYYTVKGPNNAYYEYAYGEIFSSSDIKMASGAVTATYVEPEPEPEPVTEPTENEKGCHSAALPSVFIIFTLIFPVFIKRKKSY